MEKRVSLITLETIVGALSAILALVLVSFLLVNCGERDMEFLEHTTYELKEGTRIELLKLIESQFDNRVRNLLAFEGAILEEGNDVRIHSTDNYVDISGSKEFIEYMEMLLNAYDNDGRMDWIREELGHGNVFRIDESGFRF